MIRLISSIDMSLIALFSFTLVVGILRRFGRLLFGGSDIDSESTATLWEKESVKLRRTEQT
jgi:hypothetical protein